jgi:hypothetical protein
MTSSLTPKQQNALGWLAVGIVAGIFAIVLIVLIIALLVLVSI